MCTQTPARGSKSSLGFSRGRGRGWKPQNLKTATRGRGRKRQNLKTATMTTRAHETATPPRH